MLVVLDANDVGPLAFEQGRHVVALIGIHGPSDSKVGTVSRTRNSERILLSGPSDVLAAMVAAATE